MTENRGLSTISYLALACMLCFLPACQAQPVYESPIVVQWDTTSITRADFEDMYFSFWQATEQPDSPELRQRVALEMLEQKLIANAGRVQQLEQHPGIQQRLRRDLKLFARTKYLEEEVKTDVPLPTDEEVEQAMQRQQKRYFVRQLFSLTKPGIDSLDQRLQDGEDFIELARTTLPDPTLAAAGGTLGWLAWGETDLPVEDVLFELNHGDVSPPVESLMGWHIFQVDSVEQTVLFGAPDPSLYEDTRARLYNRKLDMAAALHIRSFVWDHNLALDLSVARQMWYALAPMLPRETSQLAQALDFAAESPPEPIADQVVARVNGTPFYARQFFDALPNLPRGYLGPNLKQAIEIAIRDSLLAAESVRLGYHETHEVRGSVQRAETGYLFNRMMQLAVDSVQRAPADLEAFYEENKRLYIKHTETEVWEILLSHPDSANALAKRINEGLDFKEAARQYTQRDSVRERQGYLGFVRSDISPIGARAGTLLPGALFSPIETDAGYSIIQTGLRVPTYHDFETVRETVRQHYEQSLYTTAYARLLPKSYRPADVVLNTEALAAAFTEPSE